MNISDRQSMHGQWSSRWTFILAATGAVLLDRILPHLDGFAQNGGDVLVGEFALEFDLVILDIGHHRGEDQGSVLVTRLAGPDGRGLQGAQ